jgi:hypothetical protein
MPPAGPDKFFQAERTLLAQRVFMLKEGLKRIWSVTEPWTKSSF